jgi:phosphodiesterase/alkaline phosphatase D-like protein
MRIAWLSCERSYTLLMAGYSIVDADQPDVFIAQGDTPYMMYYSGTCFGVTTTDAATGSTVADMTAHYTQMMANPGWAYLMANVGTRYYLPDDHEWGGDNWDHTLTQANFAGSSIGAADEAAVDAHWWVGNQANIAAIAAYYDNPANGDAEAVAEKPSGAEAGTATSNYPVKYFRATHGDAEIFCLDLVSYRSPLAAVDDASKTLMGANQKAWFKAYLSASTATFKIISSSKATWRHTNGTNDTWDEFETERAEILDYIAAQEITGVVWMCGDRHYPHVIALRTADGDAYDHTAVVACPASVVISGTLDLLNNVKWYQADHVYGLLDISSTACDIYIKRAINGNPMWQGRVLAGSNALSDIPRSVGVS